MIRMRDSDIFQIKCQQVNYHRECLISIFLSNYVGTEKVVCSSSGSLYFLTLLTMVSVMLNSVDPYQTAPTEAV